MTHLVQSSVINNGCENKGRVGVSEVSVLIMNINCGVGSMADRSSRGEVTVEYT